MVISEEPSKSLVIEDGEVSKSFTYFWLNLTFLKLHSGKSLFPNICGWPLLLVFWLKWAGYLAVAGLNLLAQISDRRSPYGV